MRDLSLYDKAGPYTVNLGLDAQSRHDLEAKVREFLWDHWQQRRLSTLVITHYSKEGEPSTSSYFIERDEKGVWRIITRIERVVVARGISNSQRQESIEYSAYLVERIKQPKNGLMTRVLLSEQEKHAPQSYYLVLKDKTGKVLAEM